LIGELAHAARDGTPGDRGPLALPYGGAAQDDEEVTTTVVTPSNRRSHRRHGGDEPNPPPRTRRRGLAAFAGLNAAIAWGGAVALTAGGIELGGRLDERLPFDSPVLAGAALALIVAVPLTLLARSAWRGGDRTDDLALLSGTALLAWIVVQLAVLWAFSPFQPIYACVGAYLVGTSHRVRVGATARGVLLVAVGALAVAVGLGLVPLLVVGGWAAAGPAARSVLVVAVLVGGLASVVAGARLALRSRHLAGRLLGGAATVLTVGLVAWVVAPGVAATNVPDHQVTATPSALGLDYESVRLTTADGVGLAGWYVPGSNGAAVVVLHGAGSTRSDVLDQVAGLVRAGYAALLVDARGHGDSGGTAMDFGWFGDLDIAAGTAFLAGRPEIDQGRIGLVGFSMGGEEAIGAAGSDPLVRAVVAEGATGRRAEDRAWYSDVYGWRGWLQEQLEKVRYGIADLLTHASPPTPLRSAVSRATDTRFLLITAGTVADEAYAAEQLQDAAPGRVAVWTVEGAGHTGGYDADPAQWSQVVVDFLDATLA